MTKAAIIKLLQTYLGIGSSGKINASFIDVVAGAGIEPKASRSLLPASSASPAFFFVEADETNQNRPTLFFMAGVNVGALYVGPAPVTATPQFGDATAFRVVPANMTDIVVTSDAQLRSLLASPLSNKKLVLTQAQFTGEFVRTGAWENVWVTAQTPGAVTFTRSDYSSILVGNGGALAKQICFSDFKLAPTYTGGTLENPAKPVIISYAPVPTQGLEYRNLEIVATSQGNYNGIGLEACEYKTANGARGTSLLIQGCKGTNVSRLFFEGLAQTIIDEANYATPFFTNIVFRNNHHENTIIGDDIGPEKMAFSLSGAFGNITVETNTSINAKFTAYEGVNVRDALYKNNTATGHLQYTCGYSFSRDDAPHNQRVFVEGGTLDVSGRPAQVYTDNVEIDGKNSLWKGGNAVNPNNANIVLKNLNLLIHYTPPNAQPGVEFGGGCNNVKLLNSVVSSFGAATVGKNPTFETIVLRSGSQNCEVSGNTLKQGKKPDGSHYTNGQVVNQGEVNNAIANNTVELES